MSVATAPRPDAARYEMEQQARAERPAAPATASQPPKPTYVCVDCHGPSVRREGDRCPECRREHRSRAAAEATRLRRERYVAAGLTMEGRPRVRGVKADRPAPAPRQPRTPNAVAPIVARAITPRPVVAPPAALAQRIADRDAAIAAGQRAWCGGAYTVTAPSGPIPDPRGFWLVAGPAGLRHARIGADLAEGERAIEKHWKDGLGNWHWRVLDTRGAMADPPAPAQTRMVVRATGYELGPEESA